MHGGVKRSLSKIIYRKTSSEALRRHASRILTILQTDLAGDGDQSHGPESSMADDSGDEDDNDYGGVVAVDV